MGNMKYSIEETSMITSMFNAGSKADDIMLACAEKFGTKRSKRSITLHNKQQSECSTGTTESVTENIAQPIEEETLEEIETADVV